MGWPRVNPGDRMRIPAALHNATIETVEAHIRNKTATGGEATALRPRQATIYVRNDSGGDVAIGGVLGLSQPVWPGYGLNPSPTAAGLNQFLGAEILFLGVSPVEADHAGKFAVAIEPILSGAVGRACVQGVVRVKVSIADLDVADWADVTGGETNFLTAASSGSARILWYEGAVAGMLWAICLIGIPVRRYTFPITLTQTGGTAVANDTTQADWTYTVADALTGEELGTVVNPTAGNHKWVRPTVGYMTAATAGIAYNNNAGELVILWINEVADGAACGA